VNVQQHQGYASFFLSSSGSNFSSESNMVFAVRIAALGKKWGEICRF
jgi:hypothetical protein